MASLRARGSWTKSGYNPPQHLHKSQQKDPCAVDDSLGMSAGSCCSRRFLNVRDLQTSSASICLDPHEQRGSTTDRGRSTQVKWPADYKAGRIYVHFAPFCSDSSQGGETDVKRIATTLTPLPKKPQKNPQNNNNNNKVSGGREGCTEREYRHDLSATYIPETIPCMCCHFSVCAR